MSASTLATTNSTINFIENNKNNTNNKMEQQQSERRLSTTSESSIEPMDLGRTPTPKKYKISKYHNYNDLNNKIDNNLNIHNNHIESEISHESDENNDDFKRSLLKLNKKNKRSNSTSNIYNNDNNNNNNKNRENNKCIMQIENQDDSLKKKFRISSTPNRNNNNNLGLFKNDSTTTNNSEDENLNLSTNINNNDNNNHTLNNESGFVDTTLTTTGTTHLNNTSIISSPESGIGERDDVKYVCPICDVVSATPHEFTNHIRCHNYSSGDTENFTCRICSKVLSSASSLDRHVLVHTGERPFNCKYCHLTFTTNGNMHRHMRTHKQHQQNHQRNNKKNHMNGNKDNDLSNGNKIILNSTEINMFNSNNIGNNNIQSNNHNNNNNNSNFNGDGGESYESDGCSTDSSNSSNKQNYNNNHNINNNNNSNINFNNNNNIIINNNNNNNINANINNKRKSTDDDNGILIKRRMKTINNNNNVIINENDANNLQQSSDIQQQKFCCPVCNQNDFINMLTLSSHMDEDHSDIPAKCRQCDVVFKTHKQLNSHRCTSYNPKHNVAHGFKDLSFVNFSSEKFPLIAKSLCEQNIRAPITNQKFECFKCYLAFPCITSLENHTKDCTEMLPVTIPQDYSVNKQHEYQNKQMNNGNESENDDSKFENGNREEFFAHLDLKNRSQMSLNSSIMSSEASDKSDNDKNSNNCVNETNNINCNKYLNPAAFIRNESKDLADIQSILNVTSSSSNFLRNFEQSVNTPSSECGYGKDEEEAQDAFTAEFRKMKLRGEFPCKLCNAVFPNLRALKGHNRVHLSAVGASGPFRCNMCPYSIHDKAALVRHMRTHNGDRPYECGVCNYAFTTKANCERHLRNRHAKTTREEVKRAIIYHPSEDSTCDDPTKKIHLFSSPDFDHDEEQRHHQSTPKDRSTPVSHLKEMLQQHQDHKSMKIQVKSLEKLIDKTSALYDQKYDEEENDCDETSSFKTDSSRPIDLSMDVLDLSKKSVKPIKETISEPENIELQNKPDLQQQLFFAQQQFLNQALPKMDPTSYLQLYRNLMFSPLHPFFLQHPFLPNGLNDFKLAQLINPTLFGSTTAAQPGATSDTQFSPNSTSQNTNDQSSLSSNNNNNHNLEENLTQPTPSAQLLPKSISSPTNNQIHDSHSIPSSQPHQQPQTPMAISQQKLIQNSPSQQNNGPVKMVIKNGVLMPKQKQRRYRTERPFACEHCSARFTLRSNMERHIKQQHPQYWAQRQRTGQHVMRGRGSSSNVINQISSSSSQMRGSMNAIKTELSSPTNHFSSISDQVKYAILAQQLKARKDTDILHQALSGGTSHFTNNNNNSITNNNNGSLEDDDPKLVIDEDEADPEIDEEEDEEPDEHNDIELIPGQEYKVEDLSVENNNLAAKKVAETILEQAIKAGSNKINNMPENPIKEFELKVANTMIARAESVGKSLKEVAISPFKDESSDLASVSKLVDNATNSMTFNNYFRPSDVVNHMEQSDEEGLVASGSASDNNSGTEEITNNPLPAEQKKKSAYSLAPNRVSCPYCQRMFPWSSSLRRHILTHTGQKPFKCSHCPLLFTTKSNCDRHLLRKHGNVESAMSLYVPIEDINEPIPAPKPVALAKLEAAVAAQQLASKIPSFDTSEMHKSFSMTNGMTNGITHQSQPRIDQSLTVISSSDLPFKCHLCDCSFGERMQCLDHIKTMHSQEFALLLAKGAIDTEAPIDLFQSPQNNNNQNSTEDEEKRDESRRYPDYANRKVICAFCVRRFWSTEDLRRHMRTHSGERPFQCEVCFRKFTLKHSMLRHMKKHNGNNHNNPTSTMNSGSDLSDDEQQPQNQSEPRESSNLYTEQNTILASSLRNHKLQEILNKVSLNWQANIAESKEHNNNRRSTSIKEEQDDNLANAPINSANAFTSMTGINNSDLIGSLLGISDQGILNKLLSSADEAAKLLGIEKN